MKIYIIPTPKKEEFIVDYSCARGSQTIYEGLSVHPEVQLVNHASEADYLIWHYVPHADGVKYKRDVLDSYIRDYKDKLVVVDWTDEHDKYFCEPNECFVYFKRSWLTPQNSQIGGLTPCLKKVSLLKKSNVYPIDYAIMNDFPRFNTLWENRNIDLGCYLRDSCPNRSIVKSFVGKLNRVWGTRYVTHVGPVSNGSRSQEGKTYVDGQYFTSLGNTKINVVCSPTWWIGCSRRLESFAGGCLTFIDQDKSPLLNGLSFNGFVEDSHYIGYTLDNLPELRKKIKFFLEDPEEAEKIARYGQNYALAWHTSEARMKYVVSIIKYKEATRNIHA